MHYLIFLPGAENKPTAKALTEAGLADFVKGAESVPLATGPIETPGLLCAWRRPAKNDKLHYNAAEQTWVPSLPNGPNGEGKGRYHVGFWNDSPPTPEDLVLPRATWGEPVTLGDGRSWTLPVVQSFPRDVIRSPETGEYTLTVQERYHAAHFKAMSWLERISGGNDLSIPWGEIAGFVEEVLRLNYRLLPEVVDRLKLLNTTNVERLLLAIIGIARQDQAL
jgi:hypothetical protein